MTWLSDRELEQETDLLRGTVGTCPREARDVERLAKDLERAQEDVSLREEGLGALQDERAGARWWEPGRRAELDLRMDIQHEALARLEAESDRLATELQDAQARTEA